MKNWKLWLPDVVVVLLFVVISFAYFFPADIEGRVLYRHDSSAGRGAGQEATEYLQRTGERTRWTNALFGGMPTYQMSPSDCPRMCGMSSCTCWASISCCVPLTSASIWRPWVP